MTIDSIGYRFDMLMNELGFTKNSQVVQLKEKLPELEATTASVSRWRTHQIAGEPGPGPGMKSAKILAEYFGFSLDYLLLGRGGMFINADAKGEIQTIKALTEQDDPLILDKRILEHNSHLSHLRYLRTAQLTRSASEALEGQFLIIDTTVDSIAVSGLYVLSRGNELYEAIQATVLPSGEVAFKQHLQETTHASVEAAGQVDKFVLGLITLQL